MTKSDISKSLIRNYSYKEETSDILPQYSEISQIKEQFTHRSYKIYNTFQSNASLKAKKGGEPDLKKKSAVSFGKFFEAMDNLKKDLTEPNSACSPKSQKPKNISMNWEEVVSRLRTED